ncbi:hypothetical protein B0H63DRAFT_560290 [Podospora didyma]|uniref:Rhodopsin domain-containing protein n=1 Tax=Podospora didyma TaxID=330526 RepID=A0AAE0NQB9_9PEZI|nr:hypothetical protein B0H63DRAFT_560290 [Podospora didyma]
MGMTTEEAATVAGIILIILDVITVAGRFYSRWFTKAGWKWDDWFILLALLTGILPGALTIWASSVSATGPAAASNFNPDYVFTEADIQYTKITFSVSVLYFLVTCTTKISLLLLLHRIFGISKSFRLWIYGAEAVVAAFWFSATIADCLNCIPLEWTWRNGNADPRYCIDYNMFWLGTGVCESVIDLGILLLPLGMISKLQLNRGKKYGVAGLFLLGGFVLFSGVAKVVLSYEANSREPDFATAALWTTVHLYLGILCANLSPCWPLFNRIARVSTGSWLRLSSLGKRWYYNSSGSRSGRSKESKSTGSMPQGTWPRNLQTTWEDKSDSREYNTPISDIEAARGIDYDHEMAMYGRDGQVSVDSRVHPELNGSQVQLNHSNAGGRPQWPL